MSLPPPPSTPPTLFLPPLFSLSLSLSLSPLLFAFLRLFVRPLRRCSSFCPPTTATATATATVPRCSWLLLLLSCIPATTRPPSSLIPAPTLSLPHRLLITHPPPPRHLVLNYATTHCTRAQHIDRVSFHLSFTSKVPSAAWGFKKKGAELV